MVKLEEKASIDWNNYLTPTEVLLFLFVDDKTESAENIIYNTDGNFYKTYFKDFKKQGWTKDELVQDLADFYYNNHLDEPKQDNYKMIGLDGNHNKHILGYSKTRDNLEDMCNKVKNDYYLKDVWVEENDNIVGNFNESFNKLQENLEEQYIVLKTFVKEDPKYVNDYHIKDVVYKTTIKGQPMLEFSINGIDVKVLEYPKKDKKFYCYTNGEKYGYVSSISHLIEQLVEKYKLGGNKIQESLNEINELIEQIEYITDKCIKAGIRKQLKSYTIPCMREYMLHFNPTADNRITPWIYLVRELNNASTITTELREFADTYIREASSCYKDNVDNKLQESSQEDIREFIEKELDDGTSWDITTKLELTRDDIYKRIRLVGRKINNAKYDYERNILKQTQDFYKEVLKEIESQLKNIKTEGKEINNNSTQISKDKLEEVSRNELLAKTKMQTVSRYKRADGYKGFYLGDVDTDHLLTTDTLPVTCRVGDYWDTVELQNVLYWIQYTSEKNENNQVNNHSVRDAILQAVDAMDIKVNCECGDFIYRFGYQATKGGYKYGKPETRPAKITNPNDYGALCKHLTAMLSNKKWMQQVAAPVMDWIEKRIVEVNRFLKVKPGEELTLPNELARKNAKKGFYSKVFKGDEDVENEVEKDSEDNNTNAKDTSVSNSNRSTNNNAVDSDVDNVDNNVENEEV